MTGPTHVIIGLAASSTLSRYTGIPIDRWCIFAIMLGSLGPDIDGDGTITRPGRMFSHFIPRPIEWIIDSIFRFIGFVANRLFGHRGFFHWPIVGLLILVAAYKFANIWWFWFGWCYFIHILSDGCTIQGVPVLAPLSPKEYSLRLCSTGGIAERFIAVGFIIYLAIISYPLLPPKVRDAAERGYTKVAPAFHLPPLNSSQHDK